jgi:hypothetical protein
VRIFVDSLWRDPHAGSRCSTARSQCRSRRISECRPRRLRQLFPR